MRVHHWPYTFLFAQPAGTSRGVLRQKEAHFLEVRGEHRGVPFRGIGECGLLRGLSFDDRPDYVDRLEELVDQAGVDQVDLQVILVQLEQQTLEVVEVVVLAKVVLLMVQPAAKV